MTNNIPQPLETACLVGDLKQVRLSISRENFDIDAFMIRMTNNRSCEWGTGNDQGMPAAPSKPQDEAVKLVLRECGSRMSTRTLNRSFENSCIRFTALVPTFLELYANKLEPASIKEAILTCSQNYYQLCLDIIEKCIDRLDKTAFGWSFKLCCSKRPDLVGRLIEQYLGVPNMYIDSCIIGGWRMLCERGDLSTIELLLTKCGGELGPYMWPIRRSLCAQIFIHSTGKGYTKIAEMIMTRPEFRCHLLEHRSLINGFGTACWYENEAMIHLILNICGTFIKAPHIDSFNQSFERGHQIVRMFNESCERNKIGVAKLLYSRCAKYLQFDEGFTFEIEWVKRHPIIIQYLRETYGKRLTDQFPILTTL